MGIFTREQIQTKITNILEAMDAVMEGQSYSLDSGQGKVTVTRASLGILQAQLEYWRNELVQLESPESGIVSFQVGR